MSSTVAVARMATVGAVLGIGVDRLFAAARAGSGDAAASRARWPPTDPRFADYVASLVGAPVEPGDRYTVLRNGDEVFPPMLDAIRQAKQRISFESFIYEDGEVGDQFTAALVDAARRGVTVRIVLDAFGGELSRESQRRLTEAGVTGRLVQPAAAVDARGNELPHAPQGAGRRRRRGVHRRHRARRSLARRRRRVPRHWRDTQFKVTGPAVRALEASFYENWLESGGGSAPALDPEQPPQGTGARSVVIWSNPTGGASNVKLLYLLSIAGARSQIDIQSPYFILDESTRWSLDEARKRGVRVRILTDGDITDAKPVKYASRAGLSGAARQPATRSTSTSRR